MSGFTWWAGSTCTAGMHTTVSCGPDDLDDSSDPDLDTLVFPVVVIEHIIEEAMRELDTLEHAQEPHDA